LVGLGTGVNTEGKRGGVFDGRGKTKIPDNDDWKLGLTTGLKKRGGLRGEKKKKDQDEIRKGSQARRKGRKPKGGLRDWI